MSKKEREQVYEGNQAKFFDKDIINIVEDKKERERAITFKNYLEKIANGEATTPKNAYDIIYRALVDKPPKKLPTGYFDYPFFSERQDQFAVYGINGPLNAVTDFILTGKETGGNKKGLLLVAPSGGGKSLITEAIKTGLVEYSRSMQHPVYAVKDCPIQEDPINLLEPFLNPDKKKEIKEKQGIDIIEPCPHCQEYLKENDYTLDNVEIVPINYSIALGTGVSKIEPKLTRNRQLDSMEQINQSFLKSNRGILEIAEFFMHDASFLTTLNDLIRGRNLQYIGQQYHLDNLIITHTTLKEWVDNKDKAEFQSLLARFEVVKIPFNLSSKAEAKIYDKSLRESKVDYYQNVKDKKNENSIHIALRSLDVIAEYAVLTRTSSPEDNLKKQGLSLTRKLKLYNGENIEGFPQSIIKDLDMAEQKKENGDGFFGLSPADIESLILEITSKEKINNKKCINPIYTFTKVKDELISRNNLTKEARNIYLRILETNNERWLADCIRKAFRPDYEKAREELLTNYFENAECFYQNMTRKNPITGEQEEPDINLLETIEKKALNDKNKIETVVEGEKLRKELVFEVGSKIRRKESISFDAMPDWIKKGIDIMLFGSEEEMEEIISLSVNPIIKNGNATPEELAKRKRYQDLEKNMIEKYGFCKYCTPELIKYALDKGLLKKVKINGKE